MLTPINKDFQYLCYAEWISGDYNDVVKKSILPIFKKTYALKIREVRVLLALTDSSEKLTATDISERLRQDPATITRSMVILIGKGYVMSQANFNDGRSRLLILTGKGLKASGYFFDLFETAVSSHQDIYGEGLQGVNEGALEKALEILSNRAKQLQEAKRELAHILNQGAILAV